MMTPEQRYLFDLNGYLHLRQALSDDELNAAQKAAERYVTTPESELPEGFGKDGKRHLHGFAFDKALERLTVHPATWPIVTELTNGRPRLTSGTLQVNIPDQNDEALRLHCARDDFGWDAIRYEVRNGTHLLRQHRLLPLPHRRASGRRRSPRHPRLAQKHV